MSSNAHISYAMYYAQKVLLSALGMTFAEIFRLLSAEIDIINWNLCDFVT